MTTAVERLTGINLRGQGPVFLVGLGHGGTHWIVATFYLLLPFITKELELSYVVAGSLVSIIHLSSFGFNFLSGAIVDVSGRRALIQFISLTIGATALFLVGYASSFVWLVIIAIVIGATNNLWHPAAISFLSTRYPDNRGYALSIHALGANTGDAIAPVATGMLLSWFVWRETASINALPVFAIALLIVVVLTRINRKSGPGTAANKGMSLREYITGIGKLIRDRAVLGLCLMAGFRSMAQNGLLVFLPLYLADVMKVSPVTMGLTVMAMQAGGMIAGPIAGVASDRLGRRRVVLAGLTVTTLIIAGLTLLNQEVLFIAGVSILGFALFSVRPVIHSWMMDLTPRELSGSATSLMFGTQSGMSVLMPLIGGLVADNWGLGAVFYLLAATMLVANVLVYMLPDERKAGKK